MKRCWMVLLVALSMFSFALPSAMAEDKVEAQKELQSLPRVKGKNLQNNKKIRTSSYKGKVLVLSFWATWCGPCIQELGFFQQYYKELKDEGLEIVAIASDGPETASRIKPTMKRQKWKMPVMHDEDGSISAKLNPRGNMPFTIFVNHEGKIVKSHEGFASGDELEHLALIKKLLAEKKAAK